MCSILTQLNGKDCQREIQQQIMDEINDGELDIHMSFYLTR